MSFVCLETKVLRYLSQPLHFCNFLRITILYLTWSPTASGSIWRTLTGGTGSREKAIAAGIPAYYLTDLYDPNSVQIFTIGQADLRFRVTGSPGQLDSLCAVLKEVNATASDPLISNTLLCKCYSIEYNKDGQPHKGYLTSARAGYATGGKVWLDGTWEDTSLELIESQACWPNPCCILGHEPDPNLLSFPMLMAMLIGFVAVLILICLFCCLKKRRNRRSGAGSVAPSRRPSVATTRSTGTTVTRTAMTIDSDERDTFDPHSEKAPSLPPRRGSRYTNNTVNDIIKGSGFDAVDDRLASAPLVKHFSRKETAVIRAVTPATGD